MADNELRERIAAEAARLILRGKEQDFSAAKRRAQRWLKQRNVHRDDIPSHAEIQVQMYALSGVFASEVDAGILIRMREAALQVMLLLEHFEPRCRGAVITGQVARGAELEITVRNARRELVRERLRQAGYQVESRRPDEPALSDDDAPWSLTFQASFPGIIRSGESREDFAWSIEDLVEAMGPDDDSAESAESELDAIEVFAALRLLVEPLSRVMQDPADHPEGDALYHSLQVFELGLAERPWDEEFLLACLLHDVGLAIDRRRPVEAGLEVLGDLITDRTRNLIEQRPLAGEYIRTGKVSRGVRTHEDFEDACLLARLDRAGRVAGEQVCTLDEAFEALLRLQEECEGEGEGSE
ncbi:MAG TPA: hypothetical protein VL132_15215 [Planctomycetaceae bacterium]|nr:hypothetical protein [Planctomycetaceae bacterium]